MMRFDSILGKGRWVYFVGMLVLITAIAIILARRKSPEDIAQQRLVWGDQALETRHYEQAIAFYKKAIKNNPILLPAYFNLALAYENVDPVKAVAAWDDYLRRSERDPTQAEWVATAREHRGRLQARRRIEAAAALIARGDRAGARAQYRTALLETPANLEVLEAAAVNEEASGAHAAAASYYENAVEVAPYSLRLRYDLAGVYDRYDKAKAGAAYKDLMERSKTQVGLSKEKLEAAARRLAALQAEGYGR
jgi:tetratricopeptide (TPR) repeat protein